MDLNVFKDTNVHQEKVDIVKMGIIGIATYGMQLCVEEKNHDTKIKEIIDLSFAMEGFYSIEEYPQGMQPIETLQKIYDSRKSMSKELFEQKKVELELPTEVSSGFTNYMVLGLFMHGCGEINDIPSAKYTSKTIELMKEIPEYWDNKCENVDSYIDFLNNEKAEMLIKYPKELDGDIVQEQNGEIEPKWDMKM